MEGCSGASCVYRLCQLSAATSLCSGIDGKISVGLQPLGSGRYSHADLLEQLGQDDRSNKISHCFSVLVDEPASYKMLAQSKTFGKWKASYATWVRRCVLSGFWHVSSKLLGRSGAISSGKSLHPGHPGGHRSNCGSTQRCPEGQAERQCAEVRSLSFAKAWRWRALQKQPDLPAAPVRSPRGLFP